MRRNDRRFGTVRTADDARSGEPVPFIGPIYRADAEHVSSGRRDLNPRPLVPQTSALPGCATSRGLHRIKAA